MKKKKRKKKDITTSDIRLIVLTHEFTGKAISKKVRDAIIRKVIQEG